MSRKHRMTSQLPGIISDGDIFDYNGVKMLKLCCTLK